MSDANLRITVPEAGHNRDELERIWPTPATATLYRERFPDDWNRYDFASKFVQGKRVMDCASGAGYGSWLLKRAGATSVTGIDVSAEARAWANEHFAIEGVQFRLSVDGKIPVDTGSIDQVISLETIEHVPDTSVFVSELARVLVPQGGLVISTPLTYGEARFKPTNPFHLREFDDEEFAKMLAPHFEIVQRLGQHSLQSARFASLKSVPGLGSMMRVGVHRLLPQSVRTLGRKILGRGAAKQTPWISEDRWREAAVQLVVARKKS